MKYRTYIAIKSMIITIFILVFLVAMLVVYNEGKKKIDGEGVFVYLTKNALYLKTGNLKKPEQSQNLKKADDNKNEKTKKEKNKEVKKDNSKENSKEKQIKTKKQKNLKQKEKNKQEKK